MLLDDAGQFAHLNAPLVYADRDDVQEDSNQLVLQQRVQSSSKYFKKEFNDWVMSLLMRSK